MLFLECKNDLLLSNVIVYLQPLIDLVSFINVVIIKLFN